MSKERLEEIKRQLEESNSYDDNPNGYWYRNINWLIEQAERVQELEKEIENLETDLWHANHYRSLSVQKNKRYQEALEFYAICGQGIGETKHGEVARKALESDSDE